jgi:hypothetical protein
MTLAIDRLTDDQIEELNQLDGLDALYAELDLDPDLVNHAGFLDAYEFEYMAAHGTRPLARWYTEARARQRREANAKLTRKLDLLRKQRDQRHPERPFEYPEKAQPEAQIFRAEGELDELLSEMIGFDAIVEPAVEGETEHAEEREAMGLPASKPVAERALRSARQVITNVTAKAAAKEICAFQWDEGWAERNPSRYDRGRVEQGPLLEWGGETWNVVVTRSKPAVWDRKAERFVFQADGPTRFSVFVRTHLGIELIERRGESKPVWTWDYHRYMHFDTLGQAVSWMDQLNQAFRREMSLASDSYVYVPGEAQPFDPIIIERVQGGSETSRELAE